MKNTLHHRHKIKLTGDAARGAQLSFSTMAVLSRVMLEAARRVLRLRVEGRSHLFGAPDWLISASDMELVGLKEGSTELLIAAPPLSEVAPEIFDQITLWEPDFSRDDTPFSLLEKTLRDAVQNNRESDRFDYGVLKSVLQFRELLDLGFSSISLNGGADPAVVLTNEKLEIIEQLQKAAPREEKAIITGTLDELRHKRRSFELRVRGGRVVRGYLPQNSLEVANWWGQKVTVEGEAFFKPSGALAGIKATYISPASDKDAMYEQVPSARALSLGDLEERSSSSKPRRSIADIFGEWPGNETDEELQAELEAIG